MFFHHLMLEKIFTETLAIYTTDPKIATDYWQEIQKAHAAGGRHYHTLTHLENLIQLLDNQKETCADWHAMVFAVAWHDIVYNVLRQDNEEKSAALAVDRLTKAGVPETRIRQVNDLILATKKHSLSENPDINLFTDADLSILGAPWEVYENYTRQIRREYHIYPDLVYKPGRKKVLQHFLNMERIYKTEVFSEKFEQQAHENLQNELNAL